MHCPYHFG